MNYAVFFRGSTHRMGVPFAILVLAACLLSWTAVGARAAMPETVVIGYPDFSGGAPGLQLNGSATLAGASLQLTPAQKFRGGSSFSRTEIQPGGSFETEFELHMHDSNAEPPADGIAFVLQPGSAEALGKPGGSMGYQGIAPSVEVEFDLFRNFATETEPTDPPTPNISIMENGNTEVHVANSETPLLFQLYGETPVAAWVTYEALTHKLSVYAAPAPASKPETALVSAEIDLAQLLASEYTFAGFTSGTGQFDAVQEVLNWTVKSDLPTRFVPPPPPSPVVTPSAPAAPSTAPTTHASATQVGCILVIASASDRCTATVSDTAATGPGKPTGTVSFASGNAGSFHAGTTCKLAPVSGSASASSCSVEFLPPRNAGPAPSFTASYAGDAGHGPSSALTSYVPASALGKEMTFSTRGTLSAKGGAVEVPVLCRFACSALGVLSSGSNFAAETAAKRSSLGRGSLRLGKPGKGVLRVALNAKARRALKKSAGRAVKGILEVTVRTASGTVVKVEKKTVTIRPHPGKKKATPH